MICPKVHTHLISWNQTLPPCPFTPPILSSTSSSSPYRNPHTCIGATQCLLDNLKIPTSSSSHSLIPFPPPYPCINRGFSSKEMATVGSAAVVVPSFTGLKASPGAKTVAVSPKLAAAPLPRLFVSASLKDFGAAVVATAATALIASNAFAIDVKLGKDSGELAFDPSNFSVSAGETIVFKNNAAFPHNVVFDEDEVPGGVDVSKISMSEEALLNAPGETYSVTLTEKGTYSFYCSPHQGAGMVGKVTVN